MNGFCKIVAAVVLIAASMPEYAIEDSANYQELSSEAVVDAQNISVDNSGIEQMDLKQEILNLADNDRSADELITTVYKKEELKTFIRLDSALQEQPPECVRVTNDKLYFVYKCEGDNYLFLMYNFEDENSFPISSWYLGEKFYCKDFEALAEKKASLNEVQEFDPYGNYISYYASLNTQLYTLHQTVDGYLIRLEYSDETGEPLAVNKITKFNGENNTLYYNLLPIDKELISRK